jgi:outer membrane biosynthesis protein TonB
MADASDVYPHVLAFLVANGLSKTAKHFKKETEVEEPGDIDLVAMFEAYKTLHPSKKRKAGGPSLDGFVLPAAAAYAEEPPKKKAKKEKAESKAESPAKSPAKSPKKSPKKKKAESPKKSPKKSPVKVASPPKAKSPKAKPKDEEKPKGEKNHFQRVDNEKWMKTIKDERLKITAHKDKGGDTWGDQAAGDLLKVKGKDFRKEMAKKKRSSWKGGGAIDQTVNSIKFDSDSD